MRATHLFQVYTAPLLALALVVLVRPAAGQFFPEAVQDSLPRVNSGGTTSVLVPPDRAVLYVTLTARDTAGPAATASWRFLPGQ